MPTYVYKFVETGETIEIQQKFDDDTLTEAVHPESGATMAVKKVFLPVGITFKGDGFYKTDSRSGAGSSKSSTSSTSSDSGADSGSSKKDGGTSSSSSSDGGASGSSGSSSSGSASGTSSSGD